MSAFVGRSDELEQIRTAFGAETRIVTVTGSAGIGKTRLARELMAGPAGWWASAHFCDLTNARDADAVISSVSETLELPTGGTFGKQGNLELALCALGPALLVLDNFEQVLEASDALQRWGRAAPELRMLVTSRERLRLDDERVVELGPLELPGDDPSKAESVRMLLGCARRLRHGFQLKPTDVETVAEIAEQLDGIPLALELAAPRLVFLGATTLLERLKERFELLQSRDSTLRGAIEWSWNLLDAAERSALAQCSVFRGGFDLEAAESVLKVPPDSSVMDLLQSLFEKSLLRAEGDGRFGLFLSIREFASEQLEDHEVTQRHAEYYVALAEDSVRRLHGPETVAAWERLRTEKENLKAAARAANLGDLAARAAVALAPVMLAQGPYLEYEMMLGHALEGIDPRLEILARIHRGDARRLAGKLDEAKEDLDRALELSRQHHDAALEARALRSRGNVALVRGELDEAAECYERALPLHAKTDERVQEALTLSVLGAALAPRGRVDEAQRAEERALELLQGAGALREEGLVIAYLGNLFTDGGRFDDALVCFAEAEAIHDQVGDRFGSAFTTANRGILHHARNQLPEAIAAYESAVEAFRRVGARRYEGAFRGYLAVVRHAAGGPLDEARNELALAVQQLDEARDERFEALFMAYLGGVDAKAGALERARGLLERARDQIIRANDPFLGVAVELQHAHLWRAEGSEKEADDVVERAHAVDPETGFSPIARNADVLFSFQTLSSTPSKPVSKPTPEQALIVAKDASYFIPPGGERIELEQREALRRTLRALVDIHHDDPERALGRDELVAAGWPGERMLPRAAANRLRVAISTLRKLGLQDLILTRRSAYLLNPSVIVQERD